MYEGVRVQEAPALVAPILWTRSVFGAFVITCIDARRVALLCALYELHLGAVAKLPNVV